VERSPMPMDWQKQYSKNGYTTKSNLYVQTYFPSKSQWHSSQRLNINLKVHFETQMTANSQGNTEQKEQCRRYNNIWLQTILQSHSNKNSMVLAQKQISRPVEQNRGPWYESTQLCPPYFSQRHQKHAMENRQLLQQVLVGKVVICLQRTKTRFMPVTFY
jgi:hypothetical protein